MTEIDAARRALEPRQTAGIITQVKARPELLGERITASKVMDALASASESSGDLPGPATDADLATAGGLASWTTLASLTGLARAARGDHGGPTPPADQT